MPTITVAGQRISYQWSREHPFPGVQGSWSATMTHEPFLSAKASSQNLALQALRLQVLSHRARQAYWAAVNAYGDNGTWAAFEHALALLPDDDWLRAKLQADRAATEASWARIDAEVAKRIAQVDLEQAYVRFHLEPDADPGGALIRATAVRDAVASRRVPCPNCGHDPPPAGAAVLGTRGGLAGHGCLPVLPCGARRDRGSNRRYREQEHLMSTDPDTLSVAKLLAHIKQLTAGEIRQLADAAREFEAAGLGPAVGLAGLDAELKAIPYRRADLLNKAYADAEDALAVVCEPAGIPRTTRPTWGRAARSAMPPPR